MSEDEWFMFFIAHKFAIGKQYRVVTESLTYDITIKDIEYKNDSIPIKLHFEYFEGVMLETWKWDHETRFSPDLVITELP